MSFDVFKKIIDEAKDFVNDVYLHHRGEPLLNPDLFRMIRYAKEAGLDVRFHTNVGLLDKEKQEQLIEAAPHLVSISFDGFQKDVYEKIRVGAHFEQTVENIKGLLDLKKKRKAKSPYIVIEKIDFPKYEQEINQNQVKQLTEEFKRRGLDELIAKKEYEWVTPDAPELSTERTYSVCTFPWYAMVICFDGTVTPCPQDYMAGMNMGNVNTKSIRKIWNDEPYAKLRHALVNDINALPLCSKCDRLCRKQVSGVPFQYLLTFLADHFAGYGMVRKIIGTFERN